MRFKAGQKLESETNDPDFNKSSPISAFRIFLLLAVMAAAGCFGRHSVRGSLRSKMIPVDARLNVPAGAFLG